jgi:hypothetical protein
MAPAVFSLNIQAGWNLFQPFLKSLVRNDPDNGNNDTERKTDQL